MSGLFGSKPKPIEPEAPAPMPDPEDPLAQRARRRQAAGPVVTSSSATNRLAPVPGTIGREYSRSTLGAN